VSREIIPLSISRATLGHLHYSAKHICVCPNSSLTVFITFLTPSTSLDLLISQCFPSVSLWFWLQRQGPCTSHILCNQWQSSLPCYQLLSTRYVTLQAVVIIRVMRHSPYVRLLIHKTIMKSPIHGEAYAKAFWNDIPHNVLPALGSCTVPNLSHIQQLPWHLLHAPFPLHLPHPYNNSSFLNSQLSTSSHLLLCHHGCSLGRGCGHCHYPLIPLHLTIF
jgi:hypothetical protein